MIPKKFILLNLRQVAVPVFLLLSCFLLTASLLSAYAINNDVGSAFGVFSEKRNTADSEEQNSCHLVVGQQHYLHFTKRNLRANHPLKKGNCELYSSLYLENLKSAFYYKPTTNNTRPSYYDFLFQYTLF